MSQYLFYLWIVWKKLLNNDRISIIECINVKLSCVSQMYPLGFTVLNPFLVSCVVFPFRQRARPAASRARGAASPRALCPACPVRPARPACPLHNRSGHTGAPRTAPPVASTRTYARTRTCARTYVRTRAGIPDSNTVALTSRIIHNDIPIVIKFTCFDSLMTW